MNVCIYGRPDAGLIIERMKFAKPNINDASEGGNQPWHAMR